MRRILNEGSGALAAVVDGPIVRHAPPAIVARGFQARACHVAARNHGPVEDLLAFIDGKSTRKDSFWKIVG